MPLKLFHAGPGGPSFSPFASSASGPSPARVIALASAWIALAGNLPLWRALAALPELGNLRGLLFGLGFAVLIGACCAGLLFLLAWRFTLKPALVLFLLGAAFGAYFMLSYGVMIDTPMMTNVLQTDPRETRDLLNWRLVVTGLLLGVAPAAWLCRRPLHYGPWPRRLLGNAAGFAASAVLLVATLLLVFQDFSSVMRNHTQVRYLINPLNALWALGEIAAEPFARNDAVRLPLGEDARLGPSYTASHKPPLVVLVLGETGRAGNFAVNGYGRPTTPRLSALAAEGAIASQRNAWSCGTSTAASVPCMFSHLGRAGYDSRPANYDNLLDVLQRAGLAVLWVDNQSGCKGVCDRVAQAETTTLKVPGLCDGGECFDEVMLRGLDERIAALPAERRAHGVVVVLHQMGSHGPAYFKREPAAFKRFLPECTSNALQDCARDQVVNAYDNTIVYTDHFLAETIGWLRAREAAWSPAMVYVADHGESLGEGNLYLHGLPYAIAPDVQKRVPWITWLSPAYEQRGHATLACLNRRLDLPVSHDHYFHSVLGLLDVKTAVYQPALDLFHACAAAPAAP